MTGIGTCLWFDGQAEEAAHFYVGLFPNSRILEVSPMTVSFELDGRSFRGLNGGPQFVFNEAISFELFFDTQEALDTQWAQLTADGGAESQCGWLKDKYGLSWQLIPTMLPSVLGGADPEGAKRAMTAMLGMTKLDIAALQAAYDG